MSNDMQRRLGRTLDEYRQAHQIIERAYFLGTSATRDQITYLYTDDAIQLSKPKKVKRGRL